MLGSRAATRVLYAIRVVALLSSESRLLRRDRRFLPGEGVRLCSFDVPGDADSSRRTRRSLILFFLRSSRKNAGAMTRRSLASRQTFP